MSNIGNKTLKGLDLIRIILVLCLITMFGCGGGGDGDDSANQGLDGSGNVTLEGPPPLNLATVDQDEVTRLITAADGALLVTDAMALEVPASALTEDTVVTMTVWKDPAQGPYALVGMFEPDGLQLNDQALLTIALEPPLPSGEALNLLVIDSSDPDTLVDTGFLAEVSDDGTEVVIPVEHFSGGGCILNCHGHSVRNIVRGLLARGMTKEEILQQIRSTVGDNLAVGNESVEEAYAKLANNYDKLSTYRSCPANGHQLLAYLNTFYTLSTERPNATYNGNLATSLEPTDQECLDELYDIARSSDLPLILNFGRRFTVDKGQSDIESSSDEEPVFFDSLPHSAPIIVRANGSRVVIENGTVMTEQVAVALQVARSNNPVTSAEEIPRVVAVDLNQLDRFRGLRSGEGLKEELRQWGADDSLVSGAQTTPWAAVRIWIPRGVSPGLCNGYEGDDQDDDRISDMDDNCPDIANVDQVDSDSDGIGNVCDDTPCPDYEVVTDDCGGPGGCIEGFYCSRQTIACEQIECPAGAGRTYTLECCCDCWSDQSLRGVYDPCRPGFLLKCVPREDQ